MKKSIGGIVMLDVIIIFLVLVFFFIAGTFSYYKAYKVNRIIQNSIERYEGYNGGAQEEIDRYLSSIGYMHTTASTKPCPDERKDHDVEGYLVDNNQNSKFPPYMGTGLGNAKKTLGDREFDYCIYVYKDTDRDTNYYYSYGVVTYITMDIPIINRNIKLPVFTRTEKIYKFTTEKNEDIDN